MHPEPRLVRKHIWPWSGTWNFLRRAGTFNCFSKNWRELAVYFDIIILLKQERWWDHCTTSISSRKQRFQLSVFPWSESVQIFIISLSNVHMDRRKFSVPLLHLTLEAFFILKFYLKLLMKLSIKCHFSLNTFYFSASECILSAYISMGLGFQPMSKIACISHFKHPLTCNDVFEEWTLVPIFI